jgi:hypothetical protein
MSLLGLVQKFLKGLWKLRPSRNWSLLRSRPNAPLVNEISNVQERANHSAKEHCYQEQQIRGPSLFHHIMPARETIAEALVLQA